MNKDATSLASARFWVRPHEFEGDGSTGAALDVAAVEVGGKTRTFWLKTLENRLFFREIGRDENWNFGALEPLTNDDLPLELERVLASENYGRVVLPDSPLSPLYLLAVLDGRVRCGVPKHSLHAFFDHKYPHTMLNNHFLDWRPGAFQKISTSHSIHENAPEFSEEIRDIPVPVIPAHWAMGSQAEWEHTLESLFFCFWSDFNNIEDLVAVEWNLQSTFSMEDGLFRCELEFAKYISAETQRPLLYALHSRLRYVRKQNLFVGQTENIHRHILPRILPIEISGTIHAPTNHEILEAHLFLRDWINERLPPDKARQWLEFS